MSEKLTIEKFGEIMNDFLKENKINMLITLPEGSIEPQIQDNIAMGCVVQFYILLATLQTVFKEMFRTMNLDETEEENLIDLMMEMVKGEVNRMNEICDKCLTCHWYCDDVLEECKGQEEPCHEYSPCMEIRRVGELNE